MSVFFQTFDCEEREIQDSGLQTGCVCVCLCLRACVHRLVDKLCSLVFSR